MSVDLDRSLAELVLERPSAARVLARLGLDYCCGGRRGLAEACRERGLDPATVAVFLEHESEPVAVESTDWLSAPLAELCAHIVEEHHGRLRWDLPRLGELAERAAAVHGDKLPALHELRAEFEQLRAELEEHIAEEERELFPLLAAGGTLDGTQLEQLLQEHDTAGLRLRRLRELSGDYVTEAALCNTHRGLLQGLHGLELDLHQHVHEENNILFPRARTRVPRREARC
jgi:regulator of cell morphogenesis and NO signaling